MDDLIDLRATVESDAIAVPTDATPLDFLCAVYRDHRQPMSRRLKAAIEAAVFVHPWDMLGRERMSKFWLPWLVGMPAETCLAICSLIFAGVLERLPHLRVCFAHGGGSFPGTIGRIEHGFQVRPDLCATENSQSPRTYLRRLYVDSLVHDADALRGLIRLFGVHRIALGSDYPFPLGEAKPGNLIESMKLPAKDKKQLLSETAREFLGLA